MPFLPPGANPGAGPAQPQMQPTPQQIQAFQQQFHAEAARQGLSPQQLAEKLRQHAMAQQQQAQQSGKGQGQQSQPAGGGQGGGGGGGQVQTQQQQQVPLQPGPPKPEALAVAKFLRNQELKSRACILQEKRKDMFKGTLMLRLPSNCLGGGELANGLMVNSKTSHSCPPFAGLCQSPLQKSSSTRGPQPGHCRKRLQTPPTKHACYSRQQDRHNVCG